MACFRCSHRFSSVPVNRHKQAPRLGFTPPASSSHTARVRPCAATQPDDDKPGDSSSGVESMFAKELQRRQNMTTQAGSAAEDTQSATAEKPSVSNPPPAQAYQQPEPSQTPQLDRSRALASEGIEGLIPRARLLLQVGVTFFLGFLPLIAMVGGLFGALYFGFGEQFVHGGETTTSVPAYVDPYALLLENYNDPYYPTSGQ